MTTRMITAGVLAAGTLLVGGCGNTFSNSVQDSVLEGDPEGLRVGVETTVVLHPGVLGLPGADPSDGGTENQDWASRTISGELVSAGDGWVVLDETGGQRRWVRLKNVTWIRQATPTEPVITIQGD